MQIKRGEIWYIEKGFSVGSEQASGRPAVVISNDLNNTHSPTVEVVYLTTKPKHNLPTHVTIHSLSRISTALCEQITTVAVERIGNYCGRVTADEMEGIEAAVHISLGLQADSDEELDLLSPPPSSHPGSQKSRLCAICFGKCMILFLIKPSKQGSKMWRGDPVRSAAPFYI